MKLSEVSSVGAQKVLIYGNSGSGKTCFAAGFPTPMLYLDFDNKVDSAASYHRADKERLDQIDVRVLIPTLTQNPIAQLRDIIDNELIPQEKAGQMKYKTLVLDSITTFSAATLAYIVSSNPGIKRTASTQGQQPGLQDYGILKREFQKLIPGLLGLPMNVIMLGHISTMKDDLTGELTRGPLMDGSFSAELPIYFKEVWRSFVDKDGKHMLQTKSDYKYACRSQTPGLPNPLPMSYPEYDKYIRSNEVAAKIKGSGQAQAQV